MGGGWGQTLRIHQSQAASPVWSVRPTNQHATSESGKTRPWQSFRQGPRRLGWAGLGWAGCWAPRTRPQSPPLQTAKCSGTAAPNGQRRTSKTRKRSGTAAPNDPKKKRGPRAHPSRQRNAAARQTAKDGPRTSKTGKRSGTAAPNEPKTHQKRSVTAAENGASGTAFGKAHTNSWAGLGSSGLS